MSATVLAYRPRTSSTERIDAAMHVTDGDARLTSPLVAEMASRLDARGHVNTSQCSRLARVYVDVNGMRAIDAIAIACSLDEDALAAALSSAATSGMTYPAPYASEVMP